ncbi:MAG: VWA domain-containing protein [Acidobacteriota bacterium]
MNVRHRTTRRTLIAIPVLLAATWIAAGQAQTPASQQEPIFRTTVNYVSTSVIVHDRDGKFVPDLRQDEFRVFEDGVLQKLTNFIPMIGGRAIGGIASAATAPAIEGLVLPKAKPSVDASGRIFIIFIDDLHLEPGATPSVKQLLGKIRDNLVHDNDLVGYVSTGTSTIAIDPSYDYGHRRFDEAIKRVMGSAASADDIVENAGMESAEGPTQLRYNTHVAFATAYDMLEQLGKITDRRKSFVYVSNGYDLNPYQNARFKKIQSDFADQNGLTDPNSGSSMTEEEKQQFQAMDPTDPLGNTDYRHRKEFANADLTGEISSLVDAARRANVSFYTMDPRGLMPSIDASSRNKNLDYADIRDHQNQQIDTLKVLAEETGGFCTCNMNDFTKAIQRIDAETSDYYILGYVSSNPDPLKLRRIVKIEIARPNLPAPLYTPQYTIKPPKKN